MGRPNWTRSNEWSRASCSIALDDPTSSWARARCPMATAAVHVAGRVEGVVERLAGVAGACLGKAGTKELELLAVHYASAPRSSRRRATMLRWISALPP